MKFSIFQESRVGKRRSNQDRMAHSYSRDALMMVVADGMGGHLHGEVAAQIAVQYMAEAFHRDATPTLADPLLFLSRSLMNAHHAICDYAHGKGLPETPRTTCVACVVQKGMAYWAHAGDSRLYAIRNGSVLTQTKDHTRVQMLQDRGLLDEDGAARHPLRNRVYSCLGGPHSPQIEFSRRLTLLPGDVLALCSDGAWSPFRSHELAARLGAGQLDDVVPRLLDHAEEQSGAQCDNLTLLALRWGGVDMPGLSEAVSTRTMPAGLYTTHIKGFDRDFAAQADLDLSEDAIERAIAEINAAIEKYAP